MGEEELGGVFRKRFYTTIRQAVRGIVSLVRQMADEPPGGARKMKPKTRGKAETPSIVLQPETGPRNGGTSY